MSKQWDVEADKIVKEGVANIVNSDAFKNCMAKLGEAGLERDEQVDVMVDFAKQVMSESSSGSDNSGGFFTILFGN